MSAVTSASDATWRHVVEFLIGAGADVDRSDFDAKTPLMRAAEAGRIDVSRRLLAAAADTNLQTLNGETALMFAAKWGSTQMLTLLPRARRVGQRRTAVGSDGIDAHASAEELLDPCEIAGLGCVDEIRRV